MSKQNDPLEFSLDVDIYPPLDNMGIKEKCDELIAELDAYRRRCAIACFSETNDNPCLWEKDYANFHRGYCIEYSALDILEQFQCFLLPVVYQDSKLSFSEVLSSAGTDKALWPYYLSFMRISTKTACWKDEREWRIVRTLKDTDGQGVAIDFPKPRAVYLGYKADEIFISNMQDVCTRKNIPVFKMRKGGSSSLLT